MEKVIILSDVNIKELKGQLLTITEVSDILRVSESTIFRWIKKGSIHPIRIGDAIRFSKYQIIKLL